MVDHPGVYRGIVVNNTDPESRGRLQLQVPQLSGTEITDWVEPCVGYGISVPKAGTIVWVMYEGGDARYPVWIGTATGQGLPSFTNLSPNLGTAHTQASFGDHTHNGTNSATITGTGHTQAAYGDHTHNGTDSAGVTELLASGVAVTWDGATLSDPGDFNLSGTLNVVGNKGISGAAGGTSAYNPGVAFPTSAGSYAPESVSGDLVIRTSGHQIIFTVNGGSTTSNAILNSSGVLSAVLPWAQATHAGGPSIANSTWVPITVSLVTGSSGMTCPSGHLTPNIAGKYLVLAGAHWNTNATGDRHLQVNKNSGGAIGGGSIVSYASNGPVASGTLGHASTGIVTVNGSTDYVELFAFQNSGGALTTVADNTGFYMSVVRLGS